MTMFCKHWRKPGRPRMKRYRPEIELLDSRCLLSISSASLIAPLVEYEPNDTLNAAQLLGDPSLSPQVAVLGAVGNNSTGAADVDWYGFQLQGPAHVSLTIRA